MRSVKKNIYIFIVLLYCFSSNLLSQNESSVLYIYRDKSLINSLLINTDTKLFVDNVKRLSLKTGHFDTILIKAGFHEVRVDKMIIKEKNFESNKNYYFKIIYNSLPSPFNSNKYDLVEVEEVVARKELKELKHKSTKTWDNNKNKYIPTLRINNQDSLIYKNDLILKCFKYDIPPQKNKSSIILNYKLTTEKQLVLNKSLFKIKNSSNIKINYIQFFYKKKNRTKEITKSNYVLNSGDLLVSINVSLPSIFDNNSWEIEILPMNYLSCDNNIIIRESIKISSN